MGHPRPGIVLSGSGFGVSHLSESNDRHKPGPIPTLSKSEFSDLVRAPAASETNNETNDLSSRHPETQTGHTRWPKRIGLRFGSEIRQQRRNTFHVGGNVGVGVQTQLGAFRASLWAEGYSFLRYHETIPGQAAIRVQQRGVRASLDLAGSFGAGRFLGSIDPRLNWLVATGVFVERVRVQADSLNPDFVMREPKASSLIAPFVRIGLQWTLTCHWRIALLAGTEVGASQTLSVEQQVSPQTPDVSQRRRRILTYRNRLSPTASGTISYFF